MLEEVKAGIVKISAIVATFVRSEKPPVVQYKQSISGIDLKRLFRSTTKKS
jgi:hypothetical protein